MKRFIYTSLVCITCFFSFLAKAEKGDDSLSPEIVISTGEWKPFISQSLPDYGEYAKLVAQAFNSQGYKVEFKFFPWKRAMFEAKSGDVHATILWKKTPEREEEFLFSEQVANQDIVIFHGRNLPFDWHSVDDLKPYVIGVVRGYTYSNEFSNLMKTGQITKLKDNENLMRMLLSKRVELALMIRDSGTYLLGQAPKEQAAEITYHKTPLFSTSLHLLASKKLKESPKLITIFNKGLSNIIVN